MPKAKAMPDYLNAAKANLNAPEGITLEQYAGRAAAAQAQALVVIAEELRTANRNAETANLIAYLNAAASRSLRYDPSESVLKSVQASIEERLGLS